MIILGLCERHGPILYGLESQLNAVMIEEVHYTVGETKKGRHNDAGDEKRTKAVVNQPTPRLHLLKVSYPMNDESTLREAGCFFYG